MKDELSNEKAKEARKDEIMKQAREDAETFRLTMIEDRQDREKDPGPNITPEEFALINKSVRDKILLIVKNETISNLKITDPDDLNLYNDSLEHFLTHPAGAKNNKPKLTVN